MPMETASRVLIAAADPAERMRLAAILSEGGFSSSSCSDGLEAIPLLRATRSEILLTKMVLRSADAISVLRAIPGERMPITPAVIVLAHAGMEPFAREAREAGACAVLSSRTEAVDILSACRAVSPQDRLYSVRGRETDIGLLLSQMGFPDAHLGTWCLRTALMYTLSDERLCKDLSHRLYPLVARDRGIDPARVERSIRPAIAAAASGRYERQYAIFGNTIDEKRGKPTNGGMLARATEYLREKEIDAM